MQINNDRPKHNPRTIEMFNFFFSHILIFVPIFNYIRNVVWPSYIRNVVKHGSVGVIWSSVTKFRLSDSFIVVT